MKNTIDLERHEAKYLIPPELMPRIRDFIRPFCVPDDNASIRGALPEYEVTTLQLDSHDLSLFQAKEREAINRFKIRIRTYGSDGSCPVFLEIKRKIKGVIVKSRATIPSSFWHERICLRPEPGLVFPSRKEEENYLNFVRLVQTLGARPVVLIRYVRESYLGKNDQYSRLTFDRHLRYRPTREWNLLPQGGRWWSMDSSTAMNRDFSGVVLELKTFADAPRWMVDLTERFDLTRVGFCKYFAAVRLESLFNGCLYSEAAENCSPF